MNTMKSIEVTFRNGSTVRTVVDQFNLSTYLGNLDMDQVTAIKYGAAADAVVNAVEVKPADVDTTYRASEDMFYMDLHTTDNKRLAFVKFDPVKWQQFAVDILQQTTYHLRDVRAQR